MENFENPKTSEEVKFPEISSEILEMARADQEMREKNIENDEFWDESVDPKNTSRMKEIVAEIGWPTISKVGRDASSDAWILVQHADKDIEFQKHCLELMRQEPNGEVAPHDIAYLEDRIRVSSGQPQLYGTQFRWVDNKPIQDIQDLETVEERRAEMGLNTLKENTESMYQKYKMDKPKE